MLEAPFTSVADVGARHYWFVPVRLFMKDNGVREQSRLGRPSARAPIAAVTQRDKSAAVSDERAKAFIPPA